MIYNTCIDKYGSLRQPVQSSDVIAITVITLNNARPLTFNASDYQANGLVMGRCRYFASVSVFKKSVRFSVSVF